MVTTTIICEVVDADGVAAWHWRGSRTLARSEAAPAASFERVQPAVIPVSIHHVADGRPHRRLRPLPRTGHRQRRPLGRRPVIEWLPAAMFDTPVYGWPRSAPRFRRVPRSPPAFAAGSRRHRRQDRDGRRPPDQERSPGRLPQRLRPKSAGRGALSRPSSNTLLAPSSPCERRNRRPERPLTIPTAPAHPGSGQACGSTRDGDPDPDNSRPPLQARRCGWTSTAMVTRSRSRSSTGPARSSPSVEGVTTDAELRARRFDRVVPAFTGRRPRSTGIRRRPPSSGRGSPANGSTRSTTARNLSLSKRKVRTTRSRCSTRRRRKCSTTTTGRARYAVRRPASPGDRPVPVVNADGASSAPRVSVIIATYNRANVLPYAIGSVLDQTFADFEVLVVGDGCTDESADVVAAVEDPPRALGQPLSQHGPPVRAEQRGPAASRGEIVAYLGHDDLWLPHHLEFLVAAIGRGARLRTRAPCG